MAAACNRGLLSKDLAMGHRLNNEDAITRAGVVTTLKVADLNEALVAQSFAYCLTITKCDDRRSAERRRTRLRSGKLLDLHNAFLIECQIFDRSHKGARVRLFADVQAPNVIHLYEDFPERLLDARVVWRKQRELGLRFVRQLAPRVIGRTQLTCLRGRYYATDA
jgi:hypothetical protein